MAKGGWRESQNASNIESRCASQHAPLAQSAEQLTLNQWVLGSSPRGCTKSRLPSHEEPGFFFHLLGFRHPFKIKVNLSARFINIQIQPITKTLVRYWSRKRGTNDSKTGLRELEKQIVNNLGQLGFNPAERSRLGLATVKTETKLEALLRRKAERS